MATYIKCSGCKCLRNEATEYEVYKGKRRITCIICKANRIKLLCEHQRRRTQCKECGGSSMCEHHRRRSTCKECGGSQVCEHQRLWSICKECGGNSICEHQKERSKCKICSPHNVIINLF